MSLVLEALRKLDREKNRDERGFVVMAAAPWPTRARRRVPLWAAVGVAALVAAAAVFLMMRPPRPPASALPATSAAATAASPSAPVASLTPAIPALPASIPATRRAATPAPVLAATPMTPAASPTAAPALRLQAVSQRDGQPIAMVNDRLLRVGDEIEGMKVLAIRPDEVDLEIKGRLTTLRF